MNIRVSVVEFDDRDEGVRLQTRAADEGTVDVLDPEKAADVIRLDAAAVQDSGSLGGFGGQAVPDPLSDEGMDLGGLLG